MGFLTITRKIGYLDPINVLKTDINMGIPVDLSHQPAFYHIWMPRYNFLGARDEVMNAISGPDLRLISEKWTTGRHVHLTKICCLGTP